MLSQLPAYISAVFGDALMYELLMLIIVVLVLTIRKSLYRALRWYKHRDDDDAALRAALWNLLRGTN